jgi:hypothetical protein
MTETKGQPMKSMINIGNDVDMSKAAPEMAAALVDILTAIGEHRIDRKVAITALNVMTKVAGIGNTTISECTLSTNPIGHEAKAYWSRWKDDWKDEAVEPDEPVGLAVEPDGDGDD